MLDGVGLQLRMSLTIYNAQVPLNELHKSNSTITRNVYLRNFSDLLIFKLINIVSIWLIFNNHIIHYYASFHNVDERFTIPTTCRSTNYTLENKIHPVQRSKKPQQYKLMITLQRTKYIPSSQPSRKTFQFSICPTTPNTQLSILI
jgi:hypothetical protein